MIDRARQGPTMITVLNRVMVKKAVAACVVAAGLAGCSCTATPAPAANSAVSPLYRVVPLAYRPPPALVEMGELTGWLFDAADAGDWSNAAELLASINESASRLPDPLPHPQLAGRLQSRLEHLAEQVRLRNRVAAMEDANATALFVADISGWFQLPEESYAAYLLSCYGRQLEIGIATGRLSTLTRATTELQSTWDTLRGDVEQNGWSEAASRFTDIVVQLESAENPADYVAPTRAVRAEADRIEKVFRYLSP